MTAVSRSMTAATAISRKIDLACALGQLLLGLDELLIPALELGEAFVELRSAGVEIHRLAFEPFALLDLRALAPLFELGLRAAELVIPSGDCRLARGEVLLAPSQVGLHPLDLFGLPRIGEAVPHGREPAAFGAESPEPPPEAPLTQREFPLYPLELALADRDRRRPLAQHLLQAL